MSSLSNPKSKVVVLFPLKFDASVHWHKDVGQFADSIAGQAGLKVEFVTFGIAGEQVFNDFTVHDLSKGDSIVKPRVRLFRILQYLFRNRGQIPVFISYFWGQWSIISTLIYRVLNNGVAINKLDGNPGRIAESLQNPVFQFGTLLDHWILHRFLRSVNLVICETRALKEAMLTHPVIRARKDKLGVIPNGVSSEFLNECAKYQPRNSVEGNVLTVLLLGRINEPFKGLEIYLSAVAEVADSNLRFVICGAQGDWSRSTIDKFLKRESNSGKWLEIMEEVKGPKAVASLLSQVDILCLPSFDTQDSVEGYPLVLVEAIASGVFLIVSDSVPSAFDLLEDPFGKTFISGDSADLSLKILEVSKSWKLLEPVRQSGFSKAKELYNWEALSRIATRTARVSNLQSISLDWAFRKNTKK